MFLLAVVPVVKPPLGGLTETMSPGTKPLDPMVPLALTWTVVVPS